MKIKNRLLDTDLIIYQDDDWFKFSLDSVLLSKFVTINLRHKKIIDLATGNAPIPLLLSFRTNALIFGVEYQECVYELANQSILENQKQNQIKLVCEDVCNLNKLFSSDSFDVVTCNPPYFKTSNVDFINNNSVKSLARHEDTLKLDDVFAISRKLLKNNGRIAIVHRTERLVEILNVMNKYNIEPKKIRFIYSKINKKSELFLIEGIKNGKPGLKLLPPLIIYDENGNYSNEVNLMFGE